MEDFTPKQDRNSAANAADAHAIEIVEGNEESDWAMWSDSVAFQDSQIPQPEASSSGASRHAHGTAPVDVDLGDPFASVRKYSA